MLISRKAFLRALGSAAALSTGTSRAAGAATGAAVSVTSVTTKPMANDLSAALFLPHVGTRFRVTDSHGASTELELAQVDEVTCDACLEQFTLVFHGAAGVTPLDGLYRFEHAALDALTLFIAPVGLPNGQRAVYQACFSRMRDKPHGAS
jgi:hypothetical protein